MGHASQSTITAQRRETVTAGAASSDASVKWEISCPLTLTGRSCRAAGKKRIHYIAGLFKQRAGLGPPGARFGHVAGLALMLDVLAHGGELRSAG